MEEIKLFAEKAEIRIDTWLSEKIQNLSRTYIQKLIIDGNILVNGKNIKTNYKLKIGDEVIG